MKKLLVSLLSLMLVFLCACGGEEAQTSTSPQPPEPPVSSVPVEEAANAEPDEEDHSSEDEVSAMALEDLEIGDEVSIVGQKANSTLVNDKEIWVQVVKANERTVVYHCQLKDEYLSDGEALKMLDVVKVKGSFMSFMDLEQENTAIIVTLYDCEIL